MPNPTPDNSIPLLQLRESCGLSHARQILRIPWPKTEDEGANGWVQDRDSGAIHWVQRSALNPEYCFVEAGLDPFQQLTLIPAKSGDHTENPNPRNPAAHPGAVSFRNLGTGLGVISNGLFSLEVPFLGGHEGDVAFRGGRSSRNARLKSSEGSSPTGVAGAPPSSEVPAFLGPVCRIRVGDGPWRGRTFIDSRRPVQSWMGELLEEGPLRTVYRFSAGFAQEGFYRATVTVDRGQLFAVIEEEFQAGSGDQVVWDFADEDLPEEFYLLDSSAAYQTRPLYFHLDQRLTRMLCWTQQSQHFDFSDGYAIGFASPSVAAGQARDIAGFIALEGGNWRGAKLNHLEAWTRRWFPGDPSSRRDVAFEAKVDGNPGPEQIPARGHGICEPHFNVEGWIGQGRRKWALVLTTLDQIEPPDRSGEPLGHFEDKPDRERYRCQQSLLRRIHTQRGILPLQEMPELAWEEEPVKESGFDYPNEVLGHSFTRDLDPHEIKGEMLEYLAARVHGFWEGSGSAYTNPVVSRRIAPEMFRYEWLLRQGLLNGEERKLIRAQFAFLMHLFASENYYAGHASMLPVSSPDSLDPTIAGMANQNFYTDVINVFGTGAQVFWKHPRAGQWRGLFIERWHRQLDFHMYPESGLWEESHTYYHHVLHTVLPTLLRRRADGVDDEFANPAFQKLVGAEIKQLTPRNAFYGDRRHVVIFGDHDAEVERYRYLCREFAQAFVAHNRRLAENLAWAYCEMGGVKPVLVPAKAPDLRNEHVQGLGVMFRGIDEAGKESLFALRSGNAWGHHHSDDGSIQFYANGSALIVDAGFSGRALGRKKVEAVGHSRWTLKHLEPVNFLWRFNRGWITASALEGPLAFATAFSPVFMVRGGAYPAVPLGGPVNHFRTIVQITPSVYLVMDVSDTDQDQVILFHVPGSEPSVTEGNAEVENHGRLHVLPLPSIPPPQLAVDLPNDPTASRYVTTALQYEGQSFSAFLIAAGPEGTPAPEIVRTADCWDIRGRDFHVTVQRETSRKIVIRDHRQETTRTIDPWQG